MFRVMTIYVVSVSYLLLALLMVGDTFCEGREVYNPPTTIEGMLSELNTDPILHDELGYSFECERPENYFPILKFHTGKSYAQIDADWMKFGIWTQLLSNNWNAITGCAVVVGLDNKHCVAFATGMDGAFHMAEVPTPREKELDQHNKKHKSTDTERIEEFLIM